jgi:hypothetical protein
MPLLDAARRRFARSIQGHAVRIDPEGALVPPSCACCGADAAAACAETWGAKNSLLVPYCDACRHHVSARRTRTLSVALSSSLLALTLAGALPLVWQRISLGVFVLLVAAGSLLPVLAAGLGRRTPESGHSAVSRAAFWGPSGELVCTSADWASELARANGRDAHPVSRRDTEFSAWMLAGLLVALMAVPISYRFYRPLVRIVNLTESRLVVHLDGEMLTSVDPTSAESAAAGVEVRVPAGQRTLEARDPSGSIRATNVVAVRAASPHLYAPASESYCFWIERTGYGRAAGAAEDTEIVPLEGAARFWVLPDEIDSWFSPNPPQIPGDNRSTGGVLTALRQAPCSAWRRPSGHTEE